ncbi:hypothetical protein [Streptomyces sp. HPF1205]|uniref:hypothetical protein n=1 Tax=Streptomyces sp. HPF1205 TaxID=2873262 RepID=UPI001CEC7920|nr:hypothetical protein [Streptomyces sp. HPF1205]
MLLASCAGCAGGSHDAPQEATAPPVSAAYQDAVRSAVAASRNTSARITYTIVTTGQGATYTLTVSGSFDMASDTGALTVRFPGGAVDRMDEVFAGATVYLRAYGVLGQKWAKAAYDQVEAHSLLRAPANDPEFVLQQIAAMDQVSKATPATIDGVHTTHYTGALGLAPLTLRMAASERQELTAMKDALGSMAADAEVWVDPAGRVVRTRTSYYLQNTSVTATMTLSDAGQPVTVTVPTAAVAVPAASVAGVLPG